MKTKIFLFFAIIYLINVAVTTQTLATQNAKVDQILDFMKSENIKLRSLTAKISTKKLEKQLQSKQLEIGKIYYQPVGNGKFKFRMDISQPADRRVVIVDDEVWFYQPDVKDLQSYKLQEIKSKKNDDNIFALMLGDTATIRSQFEVTYLRDEKIAGNEANLLHLTPKQAQSRYQYIDLWISKKNGLPLFQHYEENNFVTEIELSEVNTTSKFNGKEFFDDYVSELKKIKKRNTR